MDPVTGLTERETGEGQRHMVPLMLLHIVIITRLNITQTGWHISSPQSNLFVGRKAGETCPPGETGGQGCFGFMRFWTLA